MASLFVFAESAATVMRTNTTEGLIMKQFGRNVRYIYTMKRLGYPLIGIYRGW